MPDIPGHDLLNGSEFHIIQHLGRILRNVRMIINDHCRKRHHKAFRILAEHLLILEDRRQDAHVEFRDRIQFDRRQHVLDERVRETVNDRDREVFIVRRVADDRQDLVMQYMAEIMQDRHVLHALAHRTLPVQISARDHRGVRTVQDADLALLVESDIVRPDHVNAGLLERQLIFMVAADRPEMEGLCGIDHLVIPADLFAHFIGFLAGITSRDTVNKRRAERVIV